MPSNRRRPKVKVSPQLENMKAWGVQTVVDRRAHASSGMRKRFFFSKKRAKKLYQMGQRRFNQHGLKEQSFFCFFFVHKKEVLT
jgi:hypothetical protein